MKGQGQGKDNQMCSAENVPTSLWQLGAEEVGFDMVPVKTDGSKISTRHIPTGQQVLAIRTI